MAIIGDELKRLRQQAADQQKAAEANAPKVQAPAGNTGSGGAGGKNAGIISRTLNKARGSSGMSWGDYQKYEQDYNTWKQTGKHGADFGSWATDSGLSQWRAIRDRAKTGAQAALVGDRYYSMDKDTYGRYEKDYQYWKKTGKHTKDFDSWADQGQLDTWRTIRDYNIGVRSGKNPSMELQSTINGLDPEVLQLMGEQYRASWKYGTTEEDAVRKAQGLPPKSKLKYYKGGTEFDQWLYGQGLPSTQGDYFQTMYEAAAQEIAARRQAEQADGIPEAPAVRGQDLSAEQAKAIAAAWRGDWSYASSTEDKARKRGGRMPKSVEAMYTDSEADQWNKANGLPPAALLPDYMGVEIGANASPEAAAVSRTGKKAKGAETAAPTEHIDFTGREQLQEEIARLFKGDWSYADTPEDKARKRAGRPPKKVEDAYTDTAADRWYKKNGLPPASMIGAYMPQQGDMAAMVSDPMRAIREGGTRPASMPTRQDLLSAALGEETAPEGAAPEAEAAKDPGNAQAVRYAEDARDRGVRREILERQGVPDEILDEVYGETKGAAPEAEEDVIDAVTGASGYAGERSPAAAPSEETGEAGAGKWGDLIGERYMPGRRPQGTERTAVRKAQAGPVRLARPDYMEDDSAEQTELLTFLEGQRDAGMSREDVETFDTDGMFSPDLLDAVFGEEPAKPEPVPDPYAARPWSVDEYDWNALVDEALRQRDQEDADRETLEDSGQWDDPTSRQVLDAVFGAKTAEQVDREREAAETRQEAIDREKAERWDRFWNGRGTGDMSPNEVALRNEMLYAMYSDVDHSTYASEEELAGRDLIGTTSRAADFLYSADGLPASQLDERIRYLDQAVAKLEAETPWTASEAEAGKLTLGEAGRTMADYDAQRAKLVAMAANARAQEALEEGAKLYAAVSQREDWAEGSAPITDLAIGRNKAEKDVLQLFRTIDDPQSGDLWSSANAGPGSGKYGFLYQASEAERDLFYYLCRTEGADAGFEYLDRMLPVFNARGYENLADIAQYVSDHPVLATMATVWNVTAGQIVSAVEGYAAGVGQIAYDLTGGTVGQQIVENDPRFQGTYVKQQVNADIRKQIVDSSGSEMMGMMYDFGVSLFENAARAIMFGGAPGGVIMAGSTMYGQVFASTVLDYMNNKHTDVKTAMWAGFLNAGAEALGEAVSFKQLTSLKSAVDAGKTTPRLIAQYIGHTVLKEGGSEGITSVLEKVIDCVLRKDESELAVLWDKTFEETGSKGKAWSAVILGTLKDAAVDFATGAITGLILGGGNVVLNRIKLGQGAGRAAMIAELTEGTGVDTDAAVRVSYIDQELRTSGPNMSGEERMAMWSEIRNMEGLTEQQKDHFMDLIESFGELPASMTSDETKGAIADVTNAAAQASMTKAEIRAKAASRSARKQGQLQTKMDRVQAAAAEMRAAQDPAAITEAAAKVQQETAAYQTAFDQAQAEEQAAQQEDALAVERAQGPMQQKLARLETLADKEAGHFDEQLDQAAAEQAGAALEQQTAEAEQGIGRTGEESLALEGDRAEIEREYQRERDELEVALDEAEAAGDTDAAVEIEEEIRELDEEHRQLIEEMDAASAQQNGGSYGEEAGIGHQNADGRSVREGSGGAPGEVQQALSGEQEGAGTGSEDQRPASAWQEIAAIPSGELTAEQRGDYDAFLNDLRSRGVEIGEDEVIPVRITDAGLSEVVDVMRGILGRNREVNFYVSRNANAQGGFTDKKTGRVNVNLSYLDRNGNWRMRSDAEILATLAHEYAHNMSRMRDAVGGMQTRGEITQAMYDRWAELARSQGALVIDDEEFQCDVIGTILARSLGYEKPLNAMRACLSGKNAEDIEVVADLIPRIKERIEETLAYDPEVELGGDALDAAMGGRETDEGGLRYSTTSLIPQDMIRQNSVRLQSMESVIDLSGDEFPGRETGKTLKKRFLEYFTSGRNAFINRTLGTVYIRSTSFDDDFNGHGWTDLKVRSLPAIQAVIEKGVIIDERLMGENHADRYVVAAPIQLAGTPYYMGVEVVRGLNGDNRLYLHDVVALEKALTDATAQRGPSSETSPRASDKRFLTEIITDALKVKPDYSSNVFGRVTQEQDAAYMEAVQSGDKQTQQRMVDEAAEAAMPDSVVRGDDGRLIRVYHGTDADFREFDHGRIGTTGTMYGEGFYFTDSEYAAGAYQETDESEKPILSGYLDIRRPASYDSVTFTRQEMMRLLDALTEDGDLTVLEGYARSSKGYGSDAWIRQAKRDAADALLESSDDRSIIDSITTLMGGDECLSTIREATGVDGFITTDYQGNRIYVAFDSNQFKKADPVTYHPDGTPVDLSERFNEGSADINYSGNVFGRESGEQGSLLDAAIPVYEVETDPERAARRAESDAELDRDAQEPRTIGDLTEAVTGEEELTEPDVFDAEPGRSTGPSAGLAGEQGSLLDAATGQEGQKKKSALTDYERRLRERKRRKERKERQARQARMEAEIRRVEQGLFAPQAGYANMDERTQRVRLTEKAFDTAKELNDLVSALNEEFTPQERKTVNPKDVSRAVRKILEAHGGSTIGQSEVERRLTGIAEEFRNAENEDAALDQLLADTEALARDIVDSMRISNDEFDDSGDTYGLMDLLRETRLKVGPSGREQLRKAFGTLKEFRKAVGGSSVLRIQWVNSDAESTYEDIGGMINGYLDDGVRAEIDAAFGGTNTIDIVELAEWVQEQREKGVGSISYESFVGPEQVEADVQELAYELMHIAGDPKYGVKNRATYAERGARAMADAGRDIARIAELAQQQQERIRDIGRAGNAEADAANDALFRANQLYRERYQEGKQERARLADLNARLNEENERLARGEGASEMEREIGLRERNRLRQAAADAEAEASRLAKENERLGARERRRKDRLARAEELYRAGKTARDYYEETRSDPDSYDHEVARQLNGMRLRNGQDVGGRINTPAFDTILERSEQYRPLKTLPVTLSSPVRVFENAAGIYSGKNSNAENARIYRDRQQLKDTYYEYGNKMMSDRTTYIAENMARVNEAYTGHGKVDGFDSAAVQLLGEGVCTEDQIRDAVTDGKVMVVNGLDGTFVFRMSGHGDKRAVQLMAFSDSGQTFVYPKTGHFGQRSAHPVGIEGTLTVNRDGGRLRVTDANGTVWADIAPGKGRGVNMEAVTATRDALRSYYDTALNQQNLVLVENGYMPIRRVNRYFPHMGRQETGLTDFVQFLNDANLPTGINGLTATFTPGHPWAAHMQKRLGAQTEYDAIRGFNRYVEAAGDQIYKTPVVQRLRQLENGLRKHAGRSDTRNAAFVSWLKDYTNQFANKKAALDREMESYFGRVVYQLSQKATGWFSAASVAGNLSSGLSNWVSWMTGAAHISPAKSMEALGRQFAQVLSTRYDEEKGYDGFIRKIPYLNRAFGDPENIRVFGENRAKTFKGKMLYGFFGFVDRLAKESMGRAYYDSCMSKGMSEEEAIRRTDDFLIKNFADRGTGQAAKIFGSKWLKPFAQFQLEVLNQTYHFRDIDSEAFEGRLEGVMKELGETDPDKIDWDGIGRKLYAGRLPGLGAGGEELGKKAAYLLLTALWGAFTRKIMGRDQTWNVIGTGMDIARAVGELDPEERTAVNVGKAAGVELWNASTDSLPFLSMASGGRVPVLGGLSNLYTYGKNAITGKDLDPLDRALYGVRAVANVLPGGGQLSKTARGAAAVSRGGQFNAKGTRLQYPAANTPGNWARGVLFGPSAMAPEGYDYQNDPLSEKKTQTWRGLVAEGTDPQQAYDVLSGRKPVEEYTDSDYDIAGGILADSRSGQYDALKGAGFSPETAYAAASGMKGSTNAEKFGSLAAAVGPDTTDEEFDILAEIMGVGKGKNDYDPSMGPWQEFVLGQIADRQGQIAEDSDEAEKLAGYVDILTELGY